jgi:hypothetical protein
MSTRSAQLGLWFVCLALLPLPFVSVQAGLVPVARMLLLGGMGAGVWISDPDYISALVGVMLLEGLIWSALLFFAARLVARRLPRIAIAAAVALLVVASFFPIYRTPFSSTGTASSIFEILN